MNQLIYGGTIIENGESTQIQLNGGLIKGSFNKLGMTIISQSSTGKIEFCGTDIEKGTISIGGSSIITAGNIKDVDLYNHGGDLKISGGKLESSSIVNNTTLSGGGILDVIGGEFENIKIKNEYDSELTIGEESYPVNTEYPYIKGSVINNNGIFNFYDGTIESTSSAIVGSVTKTPQLYSLKLLEEGKIATLDINATFEQVATVNGIYFNTLQAAVDATTNGIIEIEKNIILSSPVTINQEKNIKIDLKLNSIKGVLEEGIIINNGNLTIIDSNEIGSEVTGYGIIENLEGLGIQNNGTLTIGVNDENIYTNSPRIQGITYGIKNSETGILNFYDGIIKGITGAIDGTITSITNQSGYVVKEGTEVINEKNYFTKYLDK